MKTLELNQMENVQGGVSLACISGLIALSAIVGVTIVNPALAASVLLSGEGALLAAGITNETLKACGVY
ncbi:MAG: hypothetical protein JW857_06100 [Bacteroidales bacterium]|nr:hypothetical protein [Bacteroidales bacterium]